MGLAVRGKLRALARPLVPTGCASRAFFPVRFERAEAADDWSALVDAVVDCAVFDFGAVVGCADAVVPFAAAVLLCASVLAPGREAAVLDAVVVADPAAVVDEAGVLADDPDEVVVEAVVDEAPAVAAGRCALESFSCSSADTGRPFSSMRPTSAPRIDATRSSSVVDAGDSFIDRTG